MTLWTWLLLLAGAYLYVLAGYGIGQYSWRTYVLAGGDFLKISKFKKYLLWPLASFSHDYAEGNLNPMIAERFNSRDETEKELYIILSSLILAFRIVWNTIDFVLIIFMLILYVFILLPLVFVLNSKPFGFICQVLSGPFRYLNRLAKSDIQ